MDRLAPLGLIPWTIPRGGFYLWCRLPEGHDSALIARRCMKENVIVAPGNAFSVSQSAALFLRFNVAQLGDKRAYAVIKRAMDEPESN